MPESIVDDITNDDQLLRFAARSRVLQLDASQKLKNKDIAEAMGVQQSALASALVTGPMSPSMLPKLDTTILLLGSDDEAAGLTAFDARLRGVWASRTKQAGKDGEAAPVATMPARWTPALLPQPLTGPVGALTRASGVLSILNHACSPLAQRRAVDRYKDQLVQLVKDLVLIGVSPPTQHSVEALILLGSLARTPAAFEVMSKQLSAELRRPLGFRVWRVVSTVVRSIRTADSKDAADKVRPWVQAQLRDWQLLREQSLYPARSLDLELAIAIPHAWCPKGSDWAGNILRDRANMHDATVRERGTAALGVWERAFDRDPSDADNAKRGARLFLQTFSKNIVKEANDDGVATGRRWVAETVDDLLLTDQKVCNKWPETKESCLPDVREAAASLDNAGIDAKLLAATKFLFEHTVLQNAGVYRRRVIDSLRAAGLAPQITKALCDLLGNNIDPWLRCRVLFAIGFLQHRSLDVAIQLCDAYDEALANFHQVIRKDPTALTRDRISEVHAALFAMGDCFGPTEAEHEAHTIRQHVDKTLWSVVDTCTDQQLYPISRAAAYLLTVTAEDEDWHRFEVLSGHPDPITAATAEWGANARFHNGKRRALYEAYHNEAESPLYPVG